MAEKILEKAVEQAKTVTVGCKHPAGLILTVCVMEPTTELVMGGGTKEVMTARKVGEIKLNGNAVPFGQVPEHQIVGGYALTFGVDGELFRQWMKDNKDSHLVKNGLVFAHTDHQSAVSMAKERREVRSGLEPMAQDGDLRTPKNVQKETGQKAA